MTEPASADWRLETLAVHGGYRPDPTTRAAAVPIYQTVAFAFDDTQHGADLFDLKVQGNIYSRIMNPTNDVLEQRVAALEGGIGALALASGQAAVTYSILTIAEAGDNIVSSSTLYGGTYNLFAHTLPQYGISTRFADPREPAAFDALIDARTKAIFAESVGNPLGNITDIAALAEIAHRHGLPLIVDNTVPTPYLLRPFEHGADIVVHSLTKYLGGHGTSLGGAIVDSGKFPWAKHAERFRRLNEPDVSYHGVVYTDAFGAAAYIGRARVVPLRNTGAALSPFNAFQILQGIETLALRIERAGAERTVSIVPQAQRDDETGKQVGRIGAALALQTPSVDVRYGVLESVELGARRTWDISVYSLKMFGRMVTGEASLKNLSGPVTIADYAGKSARLGLSAFLSFLALVSISLGVLNLLPIPVLDGGHLLYYLVEAATGKAVSERWQLILQRAGLICIVALSAIALFNDLARLIHF